MTKEKEEFLQGVRSKKIRYLLKKVYQIDNTLSTILKIHIELDNALESLKKKVDKHKKTNNFMQELIKNL